MTAPIPAPSTADAILHLLDAVRPDIDELYALLIMQTDGAVSYEDTLAAVAKLCASGRTLWVDGELRKEQRHV